MLLLLLLCTTTLSSTECSLTHISNTAPDFAHAQVSQPSQHRADESSNLTSKERFCRFPTKAPLLRQSEQAGGQTFQFEDLSSFAVPLKRELG